MYVRGTLQICLFDVFFPGIHSLVFSVFAKIFLVCFPSANITVYGSTQTHTVHRNKRRRQCFASGFILNLALLDPESAMKLFYLDSDPELFKILYSYGT